MSKYKILGCIILSVIISLNVNAQGNVKKYEGAMYLDESPFKEFLRKSSPKGQGYYYYTEENGKRVKNGKFYFEEEAVILPVIIEGEFKNGAKTGPWKLYDKSRSYIYTINFSEDKLNGQYSRQQEGLHETINFVNNYFSGKYSCVVDGTYGYRLSGGFDSEGFADGKWEAVPNDNVKIPLTGIWIFKHGALIDSYMYDESTGEKEKIDEKWTFGYSGKYNWGLTNEWISKGGLYCTLIRDGIDCFMDEKGNRSSQWAKMSEDRVDIVIKDKAEPSRQRSEQEKVINEKDSAAFCEWLHNRITDLKQNGGFYDKTCVFEVKFTVLENGSVTNVTLLNGIKQEIEASFEAIKSLIEQSSWNSGRWVIEYEFFIVSREDTVKVSKVGEKII